MDFTKPQIAVLVLGYLKKEGLCHVANEFERTSPHVRKLRENHKKARFCPTRVHGKLLTDYLEEYATIATVVMGYLEQTDYFETSFNEQASLVDQICYLLQKDAGNAPTSTPVSPVLRSTSEVEATPAHSLPGNSCTDEYSSPKTPKRKVCKSKMRDKDEELDVSEVLTQSLLESHELHEKIAETINMELAKSVSDEHISAGASKELDAIIKTVVQRTEEDPVYNKLLDEIIGTPSTENIANKKVQLVTPPLQKPDDGQYTPRSIRSTESRVTDDNTLLDPIDDHNNDAVRCIIEASQKGEQHTTQPINIENGEVYVFDGTLDNYLKSSCPPTTNVANTNPLYINTGGLLVMPPETASQQFYIVNNQPLLSSVPSIITDSDIMKMPTIIVNDQVAQPFTLNTSVKKSRPRRQPIAPKPPTKNVLSDFLCWKKEIPPKTSKYNREVQIEILNEPPEQPSQNVRRQPETCETPVETVEPVVKPKQDKPKKGRIKEEESEKHTPPLTTPTTRTSSHIRNLDFSTPVKTQDNEVPPAETKLKAWDADLRTIASSCTTKAPSKKKKRTTTKKVVKKPPKQKKNALSKKSTKEEKPKPIPEEVEAKAEPESPPKDIPPRTPGRDGLEPAAAGNHCTPFKDILDEQIKGLDLMSLPTPSLPFTPGFSLTPGEVLGCNNRGTDYSTSSSYYQPSDTEQNKSLDQLIEESRKMDKTSPENEKFGNLKILSDVVIEQGQITENTREVRLQKFNNNVIGKKNLSLLKRETSSSSSEASESESENFGEHTEDTIIFKRKTEAKDCVRKKKTVEEILPDQGSDGSKKDDCKNTEAAFEEKTNNRSSRKNNEHAVKKKATAPEQGSDGCKIDDCKNTEAAFEEKTNNRTSRKNNEHAIKKNATVPDQSSDDSKMDVRKNTEAALDEKANNGRGSKKSCEDSVKKEAEEVATINDILNNVEVKETLAEETRRKTILSQMEEKRQRTIQRMNNPPENATIPKKGRKPTVAAPKSKKRSCQKELHRETADDESQKLVNGLAQRGIHLIPNKTPQKKIVPVEPPKVLVKEVPFLFDVKVFDSYECVTHVERKSRRKDLKKYNFEILKKTFKAQLFIEELNREDVRTIQWSDMALIEVVPTKVATEEDRIMDELMDSVVSGTLRTVSPEKKPTAKGGKKRKSRQSVDGTSDDNNKPAEKKSKYYQKNMELLNDVGLENFLDKVHGE